MELEKVTAEIRPRTQWEAVDLGLSLVQQHAGFLAKIWLCSIIPICLVILGLFWNALFWGCFLIWWMKPIWERVTLFPLSRSLFGETPKLSQGDPGAALGVEEQLEICRSWSDTDIDRTSSSPGS